MRTLLPRRKVLPLFSTIMRRVAWLSVMLLSPTLAPSFAFDALAQTISAGTGNRTSLDSNGVLHDESQGRQANQETVNNSAARLQVADQSDVLVLVQETDFNGATFHESLLDFTYTLKKTRRKLDRRSRVKEEDIKVFEAYPVMGMHVLIMLSKNGSPVSEEEVMVARKSAGENLSRAELAATDQRIAVTTAKAGSNLKRHLSIVMVTGSGGKTIPIFWDLSDFLRSCEFSAPREELLNNREAIVLEFRPRSDVYIPKPKSFIGRLVGRLWIDKLEHVVTRLEGWLPPTLKQGKEGTAAHAPAIIYEQARLPTGEWFPHYVRMNSGGNPTIFNGLNWDVIFEFSEYKRFNTGIEDVKLDAPNKKAP